MTDLSKCRGYIKLKATEGMCSHNNIKRMMESYGDAAIKVYERSGMEVAADLKVGDCQQYTKGEAGGINDAEFSSEAFDACEEFEISFDKIFNEVFGGFLNPNSGSLQTKMGISGKILAPVTKYMNSLRKQICKMKEGGWMAEKQKFLNMVMCNEDSLLCPRETTFAQNGGCNIRPFFGDAIIGEYEGSEKMIQLKFRFSESGVAFRFQLNFIGDWLLALKGLSGIVKSVKAMPKIPQSNSFIGATKTLYKLADSLNEGVTSGMTSGLTSKAEPTDQGKKFKKTNGEGISTAVKVLAFAQNMDAIVNMLGDFQVEIKLYKERQDLVAKGVTGIGNWAFELALPQLREMETLYQVIANNLGPDWHRIIQYKRGKVSFMDSIKVWDMDTKTHGCRVKQELAIGCSAYQQEKQCNGAKKWFTNKVNGKKEEIVPCKWIASTAKTACKAGKRCKKGDCYPSTTVATKCAGKDSNPDQCLGRQEKGIQAKPDGMNPFVCEWMGSIKQVTSSDKNDRAMIAKMKTAYTGMKFIFGFLDMFKPNSPTVDFCDYANMQRLLKNQMKAKVMEKSTKQREADDKKKAE